ncbi:MAG TPA: NAD(P)-dependent alcohol dehydrogenase [Nevskiales bacterium]|nr:NAD(P)-dependent alcohol dehydrogenase [Nevskiales bacterium]
MFPKRMKAARFVGKGRLVLDEIPIPEVGPLDALVRITMTTICGTDVHILKGELPVEKEGVVFGHEPIGVIEKLGSCVKDYTEGQRVVVPALTPSGYGYGSLCGCGAQDGGHAKHGLKVAGGWQFGNSMDGSQAEYLLVPNAMVNLAPIPDGLTDEQVLMCPDIMSTGFSASERAKVGIGDTVAVFACGPVGLCAIAGAKLKGATTIIAVDSVPSRMEMAKRMGADIVVNYKEVDPVAEIASLTDGRGVDVAIEALGTQVTFENALRVLRPGGTLSSLGVYSGNLVIPVDAFAAGVGDHKIITTLCPGGKERMRRMINVVQSGRVDMTPLITHRFRLDDIEKAYEVFGNQRDGVIKVAILP